MKKYLIYYITTGVYCNSANIFFDSLKNFMPNSNLDVIWLSDNFIDVNKYKNVNIIKKYILDMPFPLVSLLKLHYIYDNKLCGYDGYFYFNSDIQINKMKQDTIDLINDALINNDFITANHAAHVNSLIDDNEKYFQACFFGGNEHIFFKICEEAIHVINDKLLKLEIPTWYDETVLNEIVFTNNYKRCQTSFVVAKDIDGYDEYLQKCKHAFLIKHSQNKKYKGWENLNPEIFNLKTYDRI